MTNQRAGRRSPPPLPSTSLVVNPEIEAKVQARAQQMVRGVCQFLDVQRQEQGDVFRQALAHQFLKNFIGAIVFEALRSNPGAGGGQPPTSQEILDHVLKQFGSSKADVQEAVAFAFAEAMSAFSGRPVEYYCTISPVPEMTSKSVN